MWFSDTLAGFSRTDEAPKKCSHSKNISVTHISGISVEIWENENKLENVWIAWTCQIRAVCGR